MFDKDGNGTISKEELGNAWRILGGNPTQSDIDIMLQAADGNRMLTDLYWIVYHIICIIVTIYQFRSVMG